MPSDARTLPLRDAPLAGASPTRRRSRALARDSARERRQTRVAAGALVVLVACSLLFVVIAANRPSLFSATTHTGFFPGWMAGPLGGLWPSLTRNSIALKYLFTGALVAMYVSYLLALAYAPARLAARWSVAAVLGVHAAFFLAPPMALTDIFNYVNYGRMEVVHHLNPYTTYPILEPHGDPSYLLSNWHQLLSPYGPLFTLLTFALVPLGVAASFWVIKAVLAAASLGTIALVWRCARMLELDPVKAIVLVGLNPIVLVWGLGGDHNDFLMVFCIVLGFYLLLRAGALGAGARRDGTPSQREEVSQPARREGSRLALGLGWVWPLSPAELGAGVAFIAATALKASAGVLIPIVLVGVCRTPRRTVQLLLGMVVAGVVLGIASLLAFGLHIPDLSTQSRLVTSISVPNLIGLALGRGGETESLHTLLTAVLALSIISCCALAWRRREAITPSGWATVALLVTLGWVLPWYILWLLPLAALSRSRALRATALALGVYLIIAWAPASGILWKAIGFQPSKTPLGRLHQRYVKELLN
jgi:alpha-1,6-mannosyltransferase